MATQSGGFYSYIVDNGHHDAWKIVVLVFVLVVIGAAGWIISSFIGTDAPSVITQTVVPVKIVSDADRQAVMSAPSGVIADTSLTDKQRATVMKSTTKNVVAPDTTMTDAQRRRLMSSQ